MEKLLNGAEPVCCPPHLVYVTDEQEGYLRKKHGRGFRYFDVNGEPLRRDEEIERIKSLVIPPMWKNTWICPLPNGHLQATGEDARKRKQYLYHMDWTAYRQAMKFNKLAEFGKALPRMRSIINSYLKEPDFTRKKTLALAVKLLDCNYIRIGNDFYLNENETYGLTTIRRKHVVESKGQLRLEYKAKSGKYRKVSIVNKKLARLLKEINELPGYEVFTYHDKDGKGKIMSEDVNTFIKAISNGPFSAKDFRTWGGTVTAIDEFPKALKICEENPRKKLETVLVRRVSKVLGNTVATARKYYIHPAVKEALLEHGLEPYENDAEVKEMYTGTYLRKNEAIALKMMEGWEGVSA